MKGILGIRTTRRRLKSAPGMNTKRKGTRAEHKSMRLLEERGYKVTRAAASLGEWDLVAIGPRDVLLIQVKVNRRPGRKEMKRLEEFQVPGCCCVKLVHRWKDYAREPEEWEVK